MITTLKRACLINATFFLVASLLVADDGHTTLETAIVDGMSIKEQTVELKRAREIVRKCDSIVKEMQNFEQQGIVQGSSQYRQFVSKRKPTVRALVAAADRLKAKSIGPIARQITESTQILIVALGDGEESAFETIVKLYETDLESVLTALDRREQTLPRMWNSRTGKSSVVAEMKSLLPEAVILQRLDDGREITVPREKLSIADRRFLNRWDQGQKVEVKPEVVLREIGIDRRVND
ncbi:MAG: hypothetical protein GY768_17395 [Planctomycetaceae bacterium]|nr:hypothetical protein [Planctomycetaceae bacterium]